MTDRLAEPLLDQAGEPWSLRDHLGQAAYLLLFYRGDW